MIIVLDNKGNVKVKQQENINQGSINFNNIDLIAPFPVSTQFLATFKLPNGDILPKEGTINYKDGVFSGDTAPYLFRHSINIDENLDCWTLPLDFAVTQYQGLVEIQIKGISSSKNIVCSTKINLNIEKGVEYNDIEINGVEDLLQMFSIMVDNLNSGIENIGLTAEKFQNKISSINEENKESEKLYTSAKAVVDYVNETIGNINVLIENLNKGSGIL